MSFDLEDLRATVARHGTVSRVVITEVRGSAPREIGAAMLVWDGGQSGTIGGGRLEWDATEIARKTLQDGTPRVHRFALGPDLGQCCGGAVEVAIARYDAATLPVPGTVATPLGKGPRPEEPEVLPARREGWFFETTHSVQMPVWVYGAGHVGRALIDALHLLPDISVTWVDTDPDRFPPNPKARILPCPEPARAVTLAPPDAHHVIMTYSHEMDLALCHAVLSHGFASAGLIGSHTKWARFQKRLRALGHSDDRVAQITCPIGDPNLGRHPAAIALGVCSRLLLAAARPKDT